MTRLSAVIKLRPRATGQTRLDTLPAMTTILLILSSLFDQIRVEFPGTFSTWILLASSEQRNKRHVSCDDPKLCNVGSLLGAVSGKA